MIKNLGKYEGKVEDITIDSFEFLKLDTNHQQLIKLSQRKERIKQELKDIDKEIDQIKEQIKPLVEKKTIKWAWIWFKSMTSIKWKEEFITYAGTAAAEKVAQKYEQKKYPQIGIQYVDPYETYPKKEKESLPPKPPNKFLSLKKKLKLNK